MTSLPQKAQPDIARFGPQLAGAFVHGPASLGRFTSAASSPRELVTSRSLARHGG